MLERETSAAGSGLDSASLYFSVMVQHHGGLGRYLVSILKVNPQGLSLTMVDHGYTNLRCSHSLIYYTKVGFCKMVDRSKDSKNSNIGEIRFNELFLEVLDNSLIHILGEVAKGVLYVYLRTVLFLERENISSKPAVFDLGLKQLFGSSATAIEDIIVRELFSRMGLKISVKDTFVNLVEQARAYFILNKKWLSYTIEMS